MGNMRLRTSFHQAIVIRDFVTSFHQAIVIRDFVTSFHQAIVIRDFVLRTAFHYVFSSSCVLNGLTSFLPKRRSIARALRVWSQIVTHHIVTFVLFS